MKLGARSTFRGFSRANGGSPREPVRPRSYCLGASPDIIDPLHIAPEYA
jgi:hypothetical protein